MVGIDEVRRVIQIAQSHVTTVGQYGWKPFSKPMCASAQATAFSFWGRSRKIEPWFSIMKSGPIDSVGELPEAANESLCEDIIPPVKRRCLRKLWGRTKVGFAPYRPYPFSRRLAPWPFGSVAGRLKSPPLLIL